MKGKYTRPLELFFPYSLQKRSESTEQIAVMYRISTVEKTTGDLFRFSMASSHDRRISFEEDIPLRTTALIRLLVKDDADLNYSIHHGSDPGNVMLLVMLLVNLISVSLDDMIDMSYSKKV